MSRRRFESDSIVGRDVVIPLAINLTAPLLVMVAAALFPEKTPAVLVWGLALAVVIVAGTSLFWFPRLRRRLKVLRAGMVSYHYSFPEVESIPLWRTATKNWRYVGVSAGSVLRHFQKWTSEDDGTRRYEFLLRDPDGNSLFDQKCYEWGWESRTLDADARARVAEAVDADRVRIRATIQTLKTLNAYKAGRLTIRLYDEFQPWWIYKLDERLHVGILRRGEMSDEAPMLGLCKVEGFTTLYDALCESVERLWLDGRPVS